MACQPISQRDVQEDANLPACKAPLVATLAALDSCHLARSATCLQILHGKRFLMAALSAESCLWSRAPDM